MTILSYFRYVSIVLTSRAYNTVPLLFTTYDLKYIQRFLVGVKYSIVSSYKVSNHIIMSESCLTILARFLKSRQSRLE